MGRELLGQGGADGRERARVTPDKTALVSVETGDRFTYAELNERAERAAATLQELTGRSERTMDRKSQR